MKILINYADGKYKKTQSFNTWTGKHVARFDKVYSFGPENIDTEFYTKNKLILDIKRGNGLWLWKPYFILKVMQEANEGDVVFYCDSGAFFIRRIDSLISNIDKESDIWVSDVPLLEKNFTKYDCFRHMDCLEDIYKNTNQIQGTFFMAINSERSRSFVRKWLNYCQDKKVLCSGDVGQIENNKELIAHREDQSILSLLCKKENIPAHLDPSQRGKYPKWYENKNYPYSPASHLDSYKPILYLHKTPDVNIISCLKQYIKCVLKK
ncbi:hypothetical protein [Priestia sp. YIM B13489]|uniref:hypothetical protein n=1 Tax=Priestia sp. YIM B13489 TaxID=3366313 RepID=UPI003670D847